MAIVLYSYLNDTHIDTALKHIVDELGYAGYNLYDEPEK